MLVGEIECISTMKIIDRKKGFKKKNGESVRIFSGKKMLILFNYQKM